MFKKIVVFIVSAFLLIPMNTAFAFDNSENMDYQTADESTTYWKDRFPIIDENLNNGTLGEMVSSIETYVKYTPKNSDINLRAATENDFDVEVFDKDGYKKEVLKDEIAKINSRGIGEFEPNGECTWLRRDLQVYKTSVYDEYQAVCFFEWLQIPIFRLSDLCGIYVSSELIIGESTSTNFKHAEFRYTESPSNEEYVLTPTVQHSEYGNSVAAKFDLPGGSDLGRYTQFMGMVATPIAWSSSTGLRGRVFMEYSHSFVSVGDISFDKDGMPSFGLGAKVDDTNGSLLITR